MQLTPGARLGPYEIIAAVGAGGMGEVYRARDTRLNRTVAIKTLLSGFAGDEQRRLRFLREAKAISAISHPNICTLHDVGRENGVDYLVMEFVEGETLAAKLRTGPLPIAVAIRHAIEIADALEKAHRAGIMHRDLKPGNIIISKSGAKLLDFGLAKSIARSVTSKADTQIGSRDAPLTSEGMMVGTLDFMSPEQLQGREADQRTDIFAFGNVLYRMLAGRAPFEANTDTELIGVILQRDPPPLTTLRPDVPPALERIVVSCLKKDPDERIESAHDLKLQLQGISETAPSIVKADRSWLPWVVAAIAVVVMIATSSSRRKDPQRVVQRFSIELPPFPGILESGVQDIVISPDGSRLIAALDIGEGRQLYLRSFDRAEVLPLPGTRNASNPFFSPDGAWVGFAAEGKLHKVNLRGGSPIVVCDAPRARGATWGSDSSIVFAPMSSGDGLWKVSAAGGPSRRLTTLGPHEISHRWPHFLPDGKHVLFSIDDWGADYARKKIAVADLETGKTKILVEGGTFPRYVDPGFLVFARERALYAVQFDSRRLEVKGLPVPVVERVVTHAGTGSVQADVSRSGALVYLPYDPVAEERELLWVDRSGRAQPLSDNRRPFVMPRLSPNDKQLVVGVGESRATDLWLFNITANTWSRIAPEGKSLSPIWSRDGKQIFFSSNRFGPYDIFSIAADGSGPAKRITRRKNWPFPAAVSPDNRVLLAEEQHPVTSYDLWIIRTDGLGEEPLLTGPPNEFAAAFSPDGRWFTYTSSESGKNEVYVQRFPPAGRKWAVSEEGGSRPRWTAGGREIVFTNRGKMMVASIATTPDLTIGKPRVLFEGAFSADYDVTADGQRFVMMRENKRLGEPIRLAIILGWSESLVQAGAGSP